MEIPQSLIRFAQFIYANYDAAHDINHALAVLANAQKIVAAEGIIMTDAEAYEFPYVMIGHDFCDHKFANDDTIELVNKFYRFELGQESAAKIIHIHQNCSWSKRHTSKKLIDGDWMRLVLQDADWIEAVGEIGLTRCIEYTRSINGKVPEDVCEHIREKLLRVPTELNYQSSREMADLKPLIKYLELNEKINE